MSETAESGPVNRRVRMISQPRGYANDWSFEVEDGEVWIYGGWPHAMTESRGRYKADAGDLTPRRIPGPPWAKGYDRDVNGVWHWISRRTRMLAEPYPDSEGT